MTTNGGAAGALSGKVAWVTGGGTGIGQACARALAGAGVQVVVSGRRAAELDATSAALAADGLRASALVLDVADAQAVGRAADELRARFGRLDVLVCSAGTNVPNRSWDAITPDAFARVVSINLNGVAYCVAAALPTMRAAGGGSIVVVSSWAGWAFLPMAGAAYGATKTGLAPLVETINEQEGRHGVRATLLCPAEVATPILRTRPVPPPPEDVERMLRPDDVAASVLHAVCAPPHVCLNEIVISPTWNRFYVGADDLRSR